jgi:hypothetical protein
MTHGVFVFNPFAEGYIAHGKAFTPVRHQTLLAEDLANLPQFLCEPEDVVLVPRLPSASFLNYLRQAGILLPQFAKLSQGCIDPADSLCQRKLSNLRPWAWGPDSVDLFKPLFARCPSEARTPSQCFNEDIARLYSKAWSAGFLRKVLAHCRELRSEFVSGESRLCSEQEAGVPVRTVDDALEAIAAIRTRGHHRVAVKQAYGLAGNNAIRLWEPEILPTQRQWLTHALEAGQQLVVEPWLERELDFSVQLEMAPCDLGLCGYTGLVNDLKGQFLANWAEADYDRSLPAKVATLLSADHGVKRLYSVIFTLLETELRRAGFVGPVSIDALVYRTPQGDCQLKPVVEINPRYTMGRLTVELMKHVCPGSSGLFRLVSRGQARAGGFDGLSRYARSLEDRHPLCLEGGSPPKIRQGTLCLNDPGQAQVCLATFEVSPTPNLPASLSRNGHQRLT